MILVVLIYGFLQIIDASMRFIVEFLITHVNRVPIFLLFLLGLEKYMCTKIEVKRSVGLSFVWHMNPIYWVVKFFVCNCNLEYSFLGLLCRSLRTLILENHQSDYCM